MKDLDLIENVYIDAKRNFLDNTQAIFLLSRQMSVENLAYNIPIPDDIPAQTTIELEDLARLIQSTYVLACIMDTVSKIEKVFFIEAIERAKETVRVLENPILQAYYLSSFDRLLNLTSVMILPDVSLMES